MRSLLRSFLERLFSSVKETHEMMLPFGNAATSLGPWGEWPEENQHSEENRLRRAWVPTATEEPSHSKLLTVTNTGLLVTCPCCMGHISFISVPSSFILPNRFWCFPRRGKSKLRRRKYWFPFLHYVFIRWFIIGARPLTKSSKMGFKMRAPMDASEIWFWGFSPWL